MDSVLLYSEDHSTVIGCDKSFIGNIIVPEGVTTIKEWAFLNCSIQKVLLPNTLLYIGEHAFDGCIKLTSISFADSIKSIGEDAFVGCENLCKVQISDIAAWCRIKFHGDPMNCYANPLIYAKQLYLENAEIKDLSIPEGVEDISSSAFCGYENLTSITFPHSLKTIGNCAFNWCSGLSCITIQGGLRYVYSSAFNGCCVRKIIIKDGTMNIPDGVFSNFKYLVEICIPQTVKHIGSSAFSNCTNLKTVIIRNKDITIDLYAFVGCPNIESIVMPIFNKNLLFTCFLDCKKIETITVDNNGIYEERSVYNELVSKAQEMKQMSLFYHNRGMNLTMICGRHSDYYSYKEPLWKDGMDLEELFDSEQKTSLLLSQDWIFASGIGMALGWREYRAIDVDNLSRPENMDSIIAKFLKILELPEDYQWVVKSGSQKGFHIIIKVKEFGERILRSHKSYSFSSFEEFERIEFRWKGHIVLPPSIHYTGNSYTFYNNRIPTTDAQYVELGAVDHLLNEYCGDNYYNRYQWNNRGFDLVERRKVTGRTSDSNHSVCQNDTDSIPWLESSRTSQSYNSLAIRYVLGEGVQINPKEAYRLFQMADNDQAFFNIASLMSVGFFEGTQTEIENYLSSIDWKSMHYYNEINNNSISLEEYINDIRNQAIDYINTDDIAVILEWNNKELVVNDASFYKECKGYYSFSDFCNKYGNPIVRNYKDIGFTAIICRTEDGKETFINPPKDNRGLTLIDFNKTILQISEKLNIYKKDLVVAEYGKHFNGSPSYCLCDRFIFDVFKPTEFVAFEEAFNIKGKRTSFASFIKIHGAPIVRRCKNLNQSILYCCDEEGEIVYVIPSQSEGALSLIDFSKSPMEIASTIIKHIDNLVVLESNKESDGSPCYILIDNPETITEKQKSKENKSSWDLSNKFLGVNMNYYLFFDTETTGVPRNYKAPSTDTQNWPRLVQLAWILSDENGNRIHTGNLIVKPDGFVIPADATKVHGITTQRAKEEGFPLAEVIEWFKSDLDMATYIVGHNIEFDKKIVGAEMIRLGMKDELKKKKSCCTMLSSIDFCKISGKYGFKYPKLQELYRKLFGEDFEDAHNAMCDIEATEKCFWELRKRKLI